MSQRNELVKVKDMVLWSENPRDRIGKNISDQEFANRAINSDQRTKWSLGKLHKAMGNRLDQSEIPTVVYENNKPVVYDGNRRVLIGKIVNDFVTVNTTLDFSSFEFPDTIPCNVCDKQTALENVYRKHADSGSWDPLERDIFRHEQMQKEASPFLILDNETNIISSNPELNKRFVRDEIFDAVNFRKMGFSIIGGKLKFHHRTTKESEEVLAEVIELVVSKKITTRQNRRKIIALLKENQDIKRILENFGSSPKNFHSRKIQRKTRTTKGKKHALFGDTLILREGTVNNIYSDLCKLSKEKKYSEDFPMIIRMGIRLLCELAIRDIPDTSLNAFVENHFDDAKRNLSHDEKTTLSDNLIEKGKVEELLQTGAHGYTATNNMAKTVALSLVIGKILQITLGRDANGK